jgi:hypothetical protein
VARAKRVLSLNGGRCIYTGQPATSADHVPPKSFLAHPLPVDLPTVPACRDFNSDAGLDEQYFLTVLAQIGHHPALAWRVIEGGDIDRALRRKPALEERLINEMGVDEAGRPYIIPDQRRIGSVLRKMAAGLFFLRFGEAPGLDAFQPFALYNLETPPPKVVELSWKFEHVEPPRVIQWSVFLFGFCNVRDEHEATYCSINFYNSVFALISCPYRKMD